MITSLDRLGPAAAELSRQARARGLLLIWRAQVRRSWHVVVQRGRTEGTTSSSSEGHGLQVVTDDGRTALASRDDLRLEPAVRLLERVAEAAHRGDRLGVTPGHLAPLAPANDRLVPSSLEDFERIRLDGVAERLGQLEREIASRVPGVELKLSFHAELDAWRIFRSDGTDVLFAMPRCTLGMRATGGDDRARHGVFLSTFGSSPEQLWQKVGDPTFLTRARASARLATELPDAPNHPAGSFPLVIDYALAKGLAHEAFGHAAEADGFRSSILADAGRFQRGRRVGAEHVSVIDEPIADDHAWQPYSANGVPRERVTVVDHGRLAEALSDLWSAEPGGVRLTGAARAESFRNAPLPRMSNIRIEADGALPAPGEFEDYGPEQVRDLLAASGVLRRHPRVAYLSGYSGGQVNTSTGDFVFHCKAIYGLSDREVKLHKPAIFSGSMFGALGAIREAFGPLRLDALGHCGKWGQSVPSSGGSHYFVVLEPDPGVRLGGS